jgi:isopenicillin N synthase-like dioxygenase
MARDATAWRLDQASSQVGFFYVALPGLAEAAARLLQRCREFHDLPEATKMAVSSKLSPIRRGYNMTWRPGNGGSCAARAMIDPPDPKEVMMLGSEEVAREGEEEEEGAEAAATAAARREIHNGHSPMHGPNQWPDATALPEGWRQGLERDWATLLLGAKTLAIALARALGEPPDAFAEAMREPATVLILLRYDATRLSSGSTTGCGAHTDCGFLVSIWDTTFRPRPFLLFARQKKKES